MRNQLISSILSFGRTTWHAARLKKLPFCISGLRIKNEAANLFRNCTDPPPGGCDRCLRHRSVSIAWQQNRSPPQGKLPQRRGWPADERESRTNGLCCFLHVGGRRCARTAALSAERADFRPEPSNRREQCHAPGRAGTRRFFAFPIC